MTWRLVRSIFQPVAAAIALAALAACQDCGQGVAIRCSDDLDCPTDYRCIDLVCARSPGGPDGAAPVDASSDGQVVPTDAAGPDRAAADASVGDSAHPDSHLPDQQPSDRAPPADRYQPDAGHDAAVPDATADHAAVDSGSSDTGLADQAVADSAVEDAAPHGHCPGNSEPLPDGDLDGVGDGCDNCPAIGNTGQDNGDGDSMGDACDGCAQDPAKTEPLQCGCGVVEDAADGDGDAVINCHDNCPQVSNSSQADDDVDDVGNACDTCTDLDGDGTGNPGYPANTCALDNCPAVANANQLDSDWDELGDACDARPNEATLSFSTQTGPVLTCGPTSLASDGEQVWFLCINTKHLYKSPSAMTGTWTEVASPSTMGAQVVPGDIADSALAYDATGQRLISSRWRDNALPGANTWERERLAYYDIPSDHWTLVRNGPPANTNHGHTVVGTYLYGIWGSGGYPITRFELSGITATSYIEEWSRLSSVTGEDSADWLSNAAKVATLGGLVYLIKNDWISNPAGNGDQLMRFDPATFAFNGTTSVARLTQIPFEVGSGSALVALPAGWAGLGNLGGLLIIGGASPSNQDGSGPTSDNYIIYDLASASLWPLGHLPAAVAGGTSATFHKGRVVIKMGGADNYYFWILRPIPN